MKTIALISGGKDSIVSIFAALRYGHEPVVLVNLVPEDYTCGVHEIDSYMYQTVGHEVVSEIAACMHLPLRRGVVRKGNAHDQSLHYNDAPDDRDEVEDLYRVLCRVKEEFPEVGGVTSGAILSNYQRNRVEHVCHRLHLISLAYLWQRSANEILDMIGAFDVHAILVKTASIGLDPHKLLGEDIKHVRPTLEQLAHKYGAHMAGEGGEFETIVLNCPLFVEEYLHVVKCEKVIVDDNAYAPSGHCVLTVTRRSKSDAEKMHDREILQRLRLICDKDNDKEHTHFTFPSDRMANLTSAEELMQHLTTSMTEYVNHEEFLPISNEIMHLSSITCFSSSSFLYPNMIERCGVECRTFTASLCSLQRKESEHIIVDNIAESSNGTNHHTSYTSIINTEQTEWVQIMERTLVEVLQFMEDNSLYILAITCICGNEHILDLFREIYDAHMTHICPPCFNCILGSINNGQHDKSTEDLPFSLEVMYVSKSEIHNVQTVHAQSRSCWAAGCDGPYAQAKSCLCTINNKSTHSNVLTTTCNQALQDTWEHECSNDTVSIVFTSLTPGLVPKTWQLATWNDVLDMDVINKLSLYQCHVEEATDFIIQFSYAYANAITYLESVTNFAGTTFTHVTFCIAHDKYAPFIPTLWKECSKGKK